MCDAIPARLQSVLSEIKLNHLGYRLKTFRYHMQKKISEGFFLICQTYSVIRDLGHIFLMVSCVTSKLIKNTIIIIVDITVLEFNAHY